MHHKETFVKLAEKCPHLRLVNMPQWAGLGGVRFVADDDEPDEMTEQRKAELNHLNQRLVDSLRSTDAAFSMGTTSYDIFQFCMLFCIVLNNSGLSLRCLTSLTVLSKYIFLSVGSIFYNYYNTNNVFLIFKRQTMIICYYCHTRSFRI